MSEHATPTGMLVNGAKALGEIAILPGFSLVVDGDVKSGAIHAAAGLLAGVVLGPLAVIGWIAAGVDSYSQSVSGMHFHEHFVTKKKA